jgi:hypothetical protein
MVENLPVSGHGMYDELHVSEGSVLHGAREVLLL